MNSTCSCVWDPAVLPVGAIVGGRGIHQLAQATFLRVDAGVFSHVVGSGIYPDGVVHDAVHDGIRMHT